jgi:putative SOS response-associated peptidase YedK
VCGRVRLSSDVSEIKLVFSIPAHRPTPNIRPSWNAAPTDPLPVVRYDARAGERSLDGLVPFWAKDIKVGFSNINAKAEGIETQPPVAVAPLWRCAKARSRPSDMALDAMLWSGGSCPGEANGRLHYQSIVQMPRRPRLS